MASKDFALPHRPQGSEDDPEGIFFTLDTYQETFISDILGPDCKNRSYFLDGRTEDRGWTDRGRIDRCGSRNSYLNWCFPLFQTLILHAYYIFLCFLLYQSCKILPQPTLDTLIKIYAKKRNENM